MGYAAKLAAAQADTKTGKRRCSDTNKKGQPCGGFAIEGAEFCAGHSRARGLL